MPDISITRELTPTKGRYVGTIAGVPGEAELSFSRASPTLVIAGEEDVVMPVAEVEAMHKAIAGSSFTVLPAVGHPSNLEDTFGWRRALEKFIGGVWSFD